MSYDISSSLSDWLLTSFTVSISRSIQFSFSSVAQLCPTLCDPMNCSTPGLPVHHQLPESTQTHVHRVGDAVQPSHPLSSPSPPALNLSQHQGLSIHVVQIALFHSFYGWIISHCICMPHLYASVDRHLGCFHGKRLAWLYHLEHIVVWVVARVLLIFVLCC